MLKNLFKPKPPIDSETRKILDEAFDWMIEQFGKDELRKRKTLIPTQTDFPARITQSCKSLRALLTIICRQMKIRGSNIKIGLFDNENPDKYSMPEGQYTWEGAAGYYLGTDKNGKSALLFDVAMLNDLASLIAIMAHELSHVLLSERGLKREKNELYSDILAIYYGFGIFVAHSAFTFEGWQHLRRSGWSMHRSGYLSLQQIGYLLALYAEKKGEIRPSWRKHISESVIQYYDQSVRFLSSEKKGV